MSTSRRWPPMRDTAETSGVCLMVSSTCAAMRRNSKSPYRLLQKVSARIGTSSMERGFTNGGEAPGGIRSRFAFSFWLSRTIAFSSSCSDQEAHDRGRHAGARSGVDILHAGDLPQQLLHRFGDALFHFARRRARHLDEDVDHGHNDLRLFLARQFPHGERAQQQRRRRSPAASASNRSRHGRTFQPGRAGAPASRPDLDSGSVGKIARNRKDDLFASRQTREDLYPVPVRLPGGNQTGVSNAVIRNENGLQLAALGDSSRRDRQRRAGFQAETMRVRIRRSEAPESPAGRS